MIFSIQGGKVVFNKIHLLQRSLLCFPPDHITRSQMSVDESVGESSYQCLLQVLFYLTLVATNVRAADDPTVIIQLLLTFLLFFIFHKRLTPPSPLTDSDYLRQWAFCPWVWDNLRFRCNLMKHNLMSRLWERCKIARNTWALNNHPSTHLPAPNPPK